MTTNHHTSITTGAAANAATVNSPLGELDAAISGLIAGTESIDLLNLTDATELTISGGAITVTQSFHTVDTEGDTASDNLDTISGGAEGDVLFLVAANTARAIVIRDGEDNIFVNGDGNVTLDDTEKAALLICDGTNWMCQAFGSSAIDATNVTYTPTTAADWDSDTDPGDLDDALDQLAERVDDLEAGLDAGAVTYTPGTAADWDSSTDPGDLDDALDQLAERVTDNATGAIVAVIDGGGLAITTGRKLDISIPFACTINSHTVLADQSGSIVIDVWKDTLANYPPTDADSITASAPITISSDTDATDSTLTGWTTTISAGDVLTFNVDSATTITRAVVTIKVTR